MENMDRRESLRGAEDDTFDLLAVVLTSAQWAELLKAPLECAVRQGNRGLAQKLVRAGAEIGGALHAAVWGGHEGVVSDLLENGAPIEANHVSGDGDTPLHLAALMNATKMVQLLLLKGAAKDAKDMQYRTPLYVAALGGHAATALALMAAGADVNLPCGASERSAVHAAAEGGHGEVIRAAIERGADVNDLAICEETPLHFAAIYDTEVIDVLVEAGANIEARDVEGHTPLHDAAGNTSLEAVLALLKHNAHVNARDGGQETPLHLAVGMAGTQGAAEVVDSLLRSGADETILNHRGEAAADLVGKLVVEEDQLAAEDADRVRQLLANAPADRAWRRRGYFVLRRAHPDRMRQNRDISNARDGAARRARSSAKLGRTETSGCNETAGGSMVDGRAGGDWVRLVARVLLLQEEGIFRSIVGYL